MPCVFAGPPQPSPSLLGPERFRLLNVERAISNPGDWRAPGASELWVYHLHYFDDLNALDAPGRCQWHRRLLERWVRENPPGVGPAWQPYPLSRRIVNWLKWTARGNALPAECHQSLAVQTRWLMQRLELHLLGNHLFANAKALVYAGLYFQGPEAERWYERGMELIARELPAQVLADGGHFELSTMYHAAFLEDLLDLLNLLRACDRQPPREWPAIVSRMQGWLETLSHPDGDIAFFNDAALGIAPTAAALAAYAARLGLQASASRPAAATVLEASGYVRLAAGDACVLCDCAAVGPDHLPAHAHADSLSFEMSLGRHRLIVNSGVSEYGSGPERQRQRGTAAHSTVVVDGRDSSEVWGAFRVARRARTRIREVSGVSPAVLQASHDGYLRLAGRSEHTRRWTLTNGALQIDDQLSGGFRSAEALWHLHPQIVLRACEPAALTVGMPDGRAVRIEFEGCSELRHRQGSWHPEFGVSVANTCIVAAFGGPSLSTRIVWDPAP